MIGTSTSTHTPARTDATKNIRVRKLILRFVRIRIPLLQYWYDVEYDKYDNYSDRCECYDDHDDESYYYYDYCDYDCYYDCYYRDYGCLRHTL